MKRFLFIAALAAALVFAACEQQDALFATDPRSVPGRFRGYPAYRLGPIHLVAVQLDPQHYSGGSGRIAYTDSILNPVGGVWQGATVPAQVGCRVLV